MAMRRSMNNQGIRAQRLGPGGDRSGHPTSGATDTVIPSIVVALAFSKKQFNIYSS